MILCMLLEIHHRALRIQRRTSNAVQLFLTTWLLRYVVKGLSLLRPTFLPYHLLKKLENPPVTRAQRRHGSFRRKSPHMI